MTSFFKMLSLNCLTGTKQIFWYWAMVATGNVLGHL
jgi:hypothetical protein